MIGTVCRLHLDLDPEARAPGPGLVIITTAGTSAYRVREARPVRHRTERASQRWMLTVSRMAVPQAWREAAGGAPLVRLRWYRR